MSYLLAFVKFAILALQIYVLRELRHEEDDREADELEIGRLRDRGDDASQLLADRLRKRLLRSQGVVSRIQSALPAAGAEVAGGDGDPDPRRPLPPAAG